MVIVKRSDNTTLCLSGFRHVQFVVEGILTARMASTTAPSAVPRVKYAHWYIQYLQIELDTLISKT